MGKIVGDIPLASYHRFKAPKSKRDSAKRPRRRKGRTSVSDERVPTTSRAGLPTDGEDPPPPGAAPSPLLQPPIGMFTNARDFTIVTQNNTFVSGNSYTTVYNTTSSRRLFDYMRECIATGAAHDSGERCDAPKCHPETRVAVQEEIFDWIVDDDEQDAPQKVMWITGPAGSGKTAIAGSIAETCQERGLLAASFFFSAFSGPPNRRLKRSFIATLAYQLAHHRDLEDFASKLLASVEHDPTVFTKRLKDQAEVLLLRPLRESRSRHDHRTGPKVIIVDGLDEVELDQAHWSSQRNGSNSDRTKEDDQIEILSVLVYLVQDPAFPFRVLLASRPERAIEEFLSTSGSDVTTNIFLGAHYDPSADIERFLKSKFAFIRRRYGLSASWPEQRILDQIISKASGQFIYPATVIRFISNSRKHPRTSLNEIMGLKPGSRGKPNNPGAADAFRPLDDLYAYVLQSSPDPKLAVAWLRLICSIPDAPATFWKGFLETLEGDTNYLLGTLASLVYSPQTDEMRAPFRIYHQSLVDFLSDRARSRELFIDDAALKEICAKRFIQILRTKKPVAPLSSEQELSTFRLDFLKSTVLFFSSFLVVSDRASVRALASCDAAWWTRLVLTEQLSALDEDSVVSPEDNKAWRRRTLIEFRKLMHSGCDRQCNPACRHWSSATLAQAKAMGWCCEHGFEFVPVGSFYSCPECSPT